MIETDPNFRFCDLFLLSDKIKEFLYHKTYWHIDHAPLENIFSPYFRLLLPFKKSKTSVNQQSKKKIMWFLALEWKTTYVSMVFRLKLDITLKIKKLQIVKFLQLFWFEERRTRNIKSIWMILGKNFISKGVGTL